MSIDFRAGKTYSGPDDPNFLRDTLYWRISKKPETDEYDESFSIVHDLGTAVDTRPKTTMQLCEAVAKMWNSKGDLLFKQYFSVARALGCHNKATSGNVGDEVEPELDTAKLRQQIVDFLAKEWVKVQEATVAGKLRNPYYMEI